jgi:hypothetical protein
VISVGREARTIQARSVGEWAIAQRNVARAGKSVRVGGEEEGCGNDTPNRNAMQRLTNGAQRLTNGALLCVACFVLLCASNFGGMHACMWMDGAQ